MSGENSYQNEFIFEKLLYYDSRAFKDALLETKEELLDLILK